MGKTRLEAFSDGVIAIIITIMVLELKKPEGANSEALKLVFPSLIVYLLSFVMVGIYWNNHHHLLHVVKHVSAGIMWSNLNLLFWLSLVPFATGWLGENHLEPFPIAIYAGLFAVCGLSYNILQRAIAACHKDETNLHIIMQSQQRKGILSFIVYVLAIPLAYVNTMISVVLIVLVAIMWLIPDKKIEHLHN